MNERLDTILDRTIVGSFTRIGYALRSRSFEPLPAMTGKTVVITGATSGIGAAAAEAMASLGAGLIIVARNADKAAHAAGTLRAAGADFVDVEIGDLSLLSDVVDVAARITSGGRQIHVLVNNVGVLYPERGITAEGLEQTFATNLAGHFVLTETLIPVLVSSAPSRIINVSSGGMYSEKIRTRDLQNEKGEYKGAAAYARTKRGQVILTEVWAERLANVGVTVHAMHPGWADTPGVKESLPTFRKVTRPFLRTPDQGADTIVWLAAAEEPTSSSGEFWLDRAQRPKHYFDRTRETAEERERFLATLEKMVSPWHPQ